MRPGPILPEGLGRAQSDFRKNAQRPTASARSRLWKLRGAGGESAQDGSLDFANVVEFAIDQGLAEICRGFAVVGWQDPWRDRSCTP